MHGFLTIPNPPCCATRLVSESDTLANRDQLCKPSKWMPHCQWSAPIIFNGTSPAGSISKRSSMRPVSWGFSLRVSYPLTFQSRLLALLGASHCFSGCCSHSAGVFAPYPLSISLFSNQANHVSHRNWTLLPPTYSMSLTSKLTARRSPVPLRNWFITHVVSWEFSPRALFFF